LIGSFGVAYGAPLPSAIETGLNDILARWSRGASISAADVDTIYAPVADYYGRRLTRAQILAEKRSVAARWPGRIYRLLPGSAQAVCNAAASLCQTTAIVDWSARDQRAGRTSAGAATIRLRFQRMGARMLVTSETGRVVAARRCGSRSCRGYDRAQGGAIPAQRDRGR
jgi:hypothetical protein